MSLDCPQPANLAAIAKQLHETAVQAEEQIAAAEQQMRAAVNPPTVVRTSTVNFTGISNGVILDLNLLTLATTFDNTTGGSGFGPELSGGFTRFLGAGLYEVGLTATVVADGAVTDNSLRQFLIQQRRPDPTTLLGETVVQTVGILMFEPNTGIGMEISIIGEFRAEPEDRFAFLFFHENVASTVTLNAGANLWASKISESTLTRVL